ncbi:nitrous oxide reductase accessory protein NosL [Flagellimonas myxillae]|uniref:nitrous oxide reductase accessory protein NosL n=1 Tax=Flagellimonas myxillae TaxID=2942214 RepID=UPI00201ECDD4|nr:nitrous oxide reductase accessory protein NosL [Muricauda myxillae]MCL6267891.1 nitrous oxide reductase accessory protein NosL [Muricauda myxillae]
MGRLRDVKTLGTLLLVTIFMGCTPKPQEIVYGTDGCHFCRMTIVDAQHAAQLVTKKGKAFKFDAIECMVNHLKDVDSNSVALYLCNHYNEPTDLIDATQATFLISKEIPSPMGEFLTAFSSKNLAEEVQKDHEGIIYSWNQLLDKFNR